MSKRKIMFNEDNTHQFCEYNSVKLKRLTPEIAEEYINQFKGSQITDFLINVNSLNSSFPSKVLTSYDQKYLQKFENGISVDYTDTHARYYYESFIEDKYDMYAHWIKLLRKINITPWLSFRMNDCHNNSDRASMMLSDFYHEHKELRRYAHHAPVGYYDNCFDYAHKTVRDRMLAYIDEALDRYDVDGVELDYIREQFCFSVGGEYEGIKIMTQFVRDVRSIMAKYEKARNKKLQLSVRVPRSPEDCYYEGLDAVGWAQEGLVDVIVASPRWCPTDNDIPVEFWKEILAPYKVEFAAAVELILRNTPDGFSLNTHETALASCYANLSAGADFAYLFNYMRSNVTDFNNPDDYIMFSDLYKWDNYQHLIHNAGELETAKKFIRRHIPTPQDLAPMWKRTFFPLPGNCDNNDYYITVRVRTGEVQKDAKTTLILACSDKENPNELLPLDNFEVWINSKPVSKCIGITKIHPTYTNKPGYLFPIDNPEILTQVNMLEVTVVKNGHPFIIDSVEIKVEPENSI